ncbi:MAG TPA: tRNA pseudouridine(38-40) synthase TruA [Opitutales bacterium]|nr:tRNA pseudouridine(38-40) synthase TruA [Opitutales bacterium]
MRWKCLVAFDGTDFFGWQSQVGGNTVQDYIERRLDVIFKQPVKVHGSSRTDSGVHAEGLVFHFDAEWKHPVKHLLRAMRVGLPKGILILSVRHVPDSFHARYSASGKRYVYRIYEGWAPPFVSRFTYSLENRRLDTERMKVAAQMLVGSHDFSAFAADRGDDSHESPVKELRVLDIVRRGQNVKIVFEGSGFLYRMARSIAGALIDVGTGKLDPAHIQTILESKVRTSLVVTAPALGLTLEEVFYQGEAGDRCCGGVASGD